MKSKLMTKLALAAAIVCAVVDGAEARVDFFWKMGGVSSDSDSCSTYFFATTDDPSGWYKKKDYLTTLSDVIAQVNKGEYGNINDYYFNADGTYGKFVYSSPSAYCANTESWYDTDGTPPSAAKFIALILDSRNLSTANNYMIAKTSDGVMELSATKSEADANGNYSYTWDWGSQANNTWYSIGSGIIPVPEPTSGVLLAPGVAALALRRRKAA